MRWRTDRRYSFAIGFARELSSESLDLMFIKHSFAGQYWACHYVPMHEDVGYLEPGLTLVASISNFLELVQLHALLIKFVKSVPGGLKLSENTPKEAKKFENRSKFHHTKRFSDELRPFLND